MEQQMFASNSRYYRVSFNIKVSAFLHGRKTSVLCLLLSNEMMIKRSLLKQNKVTSIFRIIKLVIVHRQILVFDTCEF